MRQIPMLILVTGANKGIGFETARQLARKGCQVILSGRDEGRLSQALRGLEEAGLHAEMLPMDVGDTASIRQAVAAFACSKRKLDVLINNAAVLHRADQQLYQDDFDIYLDTIRTNCHGPLQVVRAFLPYLNGPGRIINLSSSGGSMSDPVGGWSPAYCVSKSLLNAITRQLAHELAPRQIAVNAVCPGWVKTDMGGAGAPRPVAWGAETPVWLATEARQGLSGLFFRDKQVIPW